MDPGALGAGYSTYQPTLAMTRLELRAEPSLQLSPTLSTYLGFGLSWGRFIAPEAESTPRLYSLDRSAVHLGYEGAVGVAYEPFADLLVFDLSLTGSLLDAQTGSAYEPVQAFTTDGHRTTLVGLSQFSGAVRALFGIGVIL
jgi:opacity protein-like surface antigen